MYVTKSIRIVITDRNRGKCKYDELCKHDFLDRKSDSIPLNHIISEIVRCYARRKYRL